MCCRPVGRAPEKTRPFFNAMLTFLDKFPYQRLHLAGFGMPPGLMFGVDELAVDGHLKCPVRRRDEGNLFNARLESLEQFGCQTGSLFGIVSNRAVLDCDVHINFFFFVSDCHINPDYYMKLEDFCFMIIYINPKSQVFSSRLQL
jgi:hypothetical protein